MKKLVLAAGLLALATSSAHAASVSRAYSYFTIGGTTVEEIESELKQRGPQVRSTGLRHPGATRMEFTTRIGYGEHNGRCSVIKAAVIVKANMILPRWRARNRADDGTRLIWDTLSADIKRHEESHVVIARNHARELEEELKKVRGEPSCAAAQDKVAETQQRILAKHDKAQERFDRIENINFESRLLRLLNYRIERLQAERRKAR